jgi:threonine/homoserine/homoserine lactone efflux protein
MTLHYFLAYFLILFVATITPGPSMLLAINHGVNHGFAKTLFSCSGNLLGNLLMAVASIVGLGAVLIASGIVFTIIKWLGIVYLVFIGIRILLTPVNASSISSNQTAAKSDLRLFLDGIVVAIGNPKGILFFTALFPQFINAEHASIVNIVVLLATLGIVASGCFMAYAICGVKLNTLFQVYSFRKWFNRITGTVFIGTGCALTFSKR